MTTTTVTPSTGRGLKAPAVPPTVSGGAKVARTFKQFGLLIQWQARRQAQNLPILIVVQSALAVATVVGYGLLMGDVQPDVALFLATGAPTITLVTVGLVMTPQQLSQAKLEGSAGWLNTLPVPRLVFLAADLALWTIIALPGVVLAIFAGVWRYDISLSVTWWLPFAALLISLTAAAVGYAMASLLPPMVAMLTTQLLVFILLLFSPISFPAANLPEWLQTVHDVLPIEPMADLMRAGLASEAFSIDGTKVLILCGWCLLAIVGAGRSLTRRP